MTIIYFIEQHSTYLPIVRPIFELVSKGEIAGFSSYIALLEVLVKPLKEHRQDLVRRYRDILIGSRSFVLYPIDRAIAEKSAEVRAAYEVRTPDAIQLATASLLGARAFVTNDAKLKRFTDVEILVLDDFVSVPPSEGSGT